VKVAVRGIMIVLVVTVFLGCSGLGGCTAALERPSVLVVAARDSSELSKSRADVVCDGIADEVEIGSALAAVSPGGKVVLTEGTFHCNEDLHFEPHTTLEGQGEYQTYLNCSGECSGVAMNDENLTIKALTITNRGGIFITQTAHIKVHQVVIDSPHLFQNGAFSMWMNANETLEDIEFIDCKALNVPGFGFWTCGEGPGQVQKNVRYINCQAIGCGGGDRGGDNGTPSDSTGLWSGGFSFQETNAAEDILVKGCYAEGNWQSGFHQEPSNPTKNFTIEDCISRNNGQKAKYVKDPDTLDGSPDMVFGAGYFLCTNVTLRNCTAEGNYHGVELWWGQGCIIENCTTRNSLAEDYYLVHGSGRLMPNIFRNCVSDHAGMHALSATVGTKGAYFINFTAVNPQGDGVHCLKIGSRNDNILDPCKDSFFDIKVLGGGSPIALGVERGRNLTFTGTIETTQPYPVFIDGWDTAAISIQGMRINIESDDQRATGIFIPPAVKKAGTIMITNSTIIDPRPVPKLQYGVNNSAQAQVVVSNLSVIGAVTPWSHCYVTVENFNNSLLPQVLYHPRSTILMSTFTNFTIRHEYPSLAALGDQLGEIQGLIDWDAFRPLLVDQYTIDTGNGGRPNYNYAV
jgi:parallel beta-helix repeat protein